MSQLGQERRISAVCNISASLLKADVERTFDYRGFVPKAVVSTRTLRPAIEDYFDPARCDEKPLFRQRMHVYQRIATPASSLPENDVETGHVRIIGAGEDERLPTPISTHASMRWKVFCSVNKIVSGRPFLPL
jgi:hypothetical protein